MTLPRDMTFANVLVTGGASGLGLALARAFAAEGAGIALVDAAGERLGAALATIRSLGVRCEGFTCDVRDDAAVDAAFESAWNLVGPIDVLCANAGVVTRGSILEVSREEFDWVMGVNAWGVVNASRSYVRRARAAKRAGHILVTGSETSLSHPRLVRDLAIHPYLASKHAVLAIADQLRHDLARDGIGVSIVCPGAFESSLGVNSKGLRPKGLRSRARPDSGNPNPWGNPNPSVNANSPAFAAMSGMTISADAVAEFAIRGMRAGLYLIPTHAVIREDVRERCEEILAAFPQLGIG